MNHHGCSCWPALIPSCSPAAQAFPAGRCDASVTYSGACGRRLARLFQGRDIVEHVVTHAHGDHIGCTAWICNHTGAPLAMLDTRQGIVVFAILVRGSRPATPPWGASTPTVTRLLLHRLSSGAAEMSARFSTLPGARHGSIRRTFARPCRLPVASRRGEGPRKCAG